jgi:hypothetical protein
MVCDALGYAGYDSEELEKLTKLVAEMKSPLYPGYNEKWTKLFASLKFLQLNATHRMIDHGFKAILDLLRNMLLERNKMPMTTYEAKQNICPLGLVVEKIHACKNDGVLFHGNDYAYLTECLVCGAPQ